MQSIINKQKTNEIQLYSFDIFDTLVTRTVAWPVGIFTIMQMVMSNNPKYNFMPKYLIDNFYTVRIEAESYTRVNYFETNNSHEITLQDIYETIKRNYYLKQEEIKLLMELEIDIEIKNIKPIDKNINILKQLINDGKRVILISDMYHSKEVLKRILVHIDPLFEDLKIYVSSEYNKTKSRGLLYELVEECEQVSPKNWLHFGDNEHADIKQAKKKNLLTKKIEKESMMPYEEYALKYYENNFFIQSIIGIAKYTRLQKICSNRTYKFGCSFAAPILYNFVSWIIEQSIIRGFKTLNFVARDGYILKCIADEIIKYKNIPLKTKYIYGSRIAWRLPDESNIDEYINWTLAEYSDRMCLKFLSKRLNVDLNMLKEISSIHDENKIFNKKTIIKLKKLLTENKELKQHLIKINNNKKELLIKYLKENLDLSEETIVLVDTNGSGRTQDMLFNIIKEFFEGKIFGFYFHTCFNSTQSLSEKISYLANTRYFNHAIELLCRNIDGQTLEYKENNDKIMPVLEYNKSSYLLKWGFNEYVQAIKDFTINACQFELINNISLETFDIYKIYYTYFVTELDRETSNIIGSIPYTAVGDETNVKECAPKKGLISSIINKKAIYYLDYISICRSSILIKFIEFINEKYGSIRKFLVNVYINKNEEKAYLRILGMKLSFSKLIWRNR